MSTTLRERTAGDGISLAERRWCPADEPWARLLLVHGLAEHLGRWEPIGDFLANAGIDVAGADLRGFGASAGPRADLDRWSRFLDDLDEQLVDLRAASPPRPVVLYGHSLGSMIALGHVLSSRPTADALVLTGPAIDDDLARWKHALAPVLARIVPTLRLANGIEPEQLAAHPRPGFSYDDPLVVKTSTTRFGRLSFAEQARLRGVLADLDDLPVPTLVVRGEDDPIVPARVLPLLGRFPSVTVRSYPGLRHEVHNEAAGDAVLADLVSWLRERLTGERV